MSYSYQPPHYSQASAQSSSNAAAQHLQFFPSTYGSPGPGTVSGHTTPSQASYAYSSSGPTSHGASAYPGYGGSAGGGLGGAGGMGGVSGRMGEQGGLRTGWLAAFGTEGYEGEPGLLEELGVNFDHIQTKTLAVLNPLHPPSSHIMDDADLYGALLFLILYGTFLALSGKFFYGYIYGIALFGSLALHLIFSLMTPAESEPHPSQHHHHHQNSPGSSISGGHFSSTLTYSRSASVLGYSFLPLVLTSLVGIVLSMDSLFGYLLTTAAVGWCTYASSGMFVSVGRMQGMQMRGLVAYPLALFYTGFGIMGIFSSRGNAAGESFAKGGRGT